MSLPPSWMKCWSTSTLTGSSRYATLASPTRALELTLLQTYFDHRRPRFDPVVCVNTLSLFYSHGRGSELHRTLQWVYEVLLNRAYLDGTRYYETPECFLFFLSRLLHCSDSHELHQFLKPLLRERVQERIGAEGDALAFAMRILTCACVGVRDDVDLRMLLPLQCEDGGWDIGWIYRYGSSGIKIGNRGLTTALAINAIEVMEKSYSLSSPSSPISPSLPSPPSSPPPFLAAANKVEVSAASRQQRVIAVSSRRRSGSFRNSIQWLWHGGKLRKPLEAGF